MLTQIFVIVINGKDTVSLISNLNEIQDVKVYVNGQCLQKWQIVQDKLNERHIACHVVLGKVGKALREV